MFKNKLLKMLSSNLVEMHVFHISSIGFEQQTSSVLVTNKSFLINVLFNPYWFTWVKSDSNNEY